MFKLWSFSRRNVAQLEYDAYRAGHVGHHASMLRRLKGLRGYCVDLRADTLLQQRLGPLHQDISFGEPVAFPELWDGLSTLYFDSPERAAQAAVPEPTRATADGLSADADWHCDDGPHLFDAAGWGMGMPPHRPVEEHVLLPVVRPERKLTKLLQFFRRHPTQPEATFRSVLLDRYARLTASMSVLQGYVVNFEHRAQTPASLGLPTAASTAAPSSDGWASWDGVCELYVDSLGDFAIARVDLALHPELCVLERHLFEALWYAEVDENVIVMPNRDPAPDFYYR